MHLIELAEKTGMDYQSTLERFAGMKPMLCKFVKKLPEDGSFERLAKAVEEKDYCSVEREAHTLKGVAANLGFRELAECSGKIVAAVRDNDTEHIDELFRDGKEVYEKIIAYIYQLED